MSPTNAASNPAPNARPRMDLDNLLRRELRIGDPNDPQQIAQALSERYQSDLRAQSIEGEARGLPFLRTPQLRPSAPPPPQATNVDLEQARSDVQSDMHQLVSHNLTKDIRPELEGWQQVIHRAIDDGVQAARAGLDPVKRDVTFGMRRQLGEYARLSRLIGALTPALNRQFRNLAQSLDEVCAVMLVLMGESMANLGFSGGRFLLSTSYSEMQARRDSVINALRQIDGLAAQANNGSLWPRGLRAYRTLTSALEAQGQGDLRSLLGEDELARTMDELILLAGGGSSGGMRALGATAWAPLNRLTRFVDNTIAPVAPAASELANLHEALQLFIDGLVPAGGFRLLRVARPAVLNYGLYGSYRFSKAEGRLIDLVNRRGSLARELDCFTDCNCDDDAILGQIVLDKVLFDLDRAIDFYCAGDADLGLPETRASALALTLDFVTTPLLWGGAHPGYLGGGGLPHVNLITGTLLTELARTNALLRPTAAAIDADWDTTRPTYDANLNGNLPFPGGVSVRFAQAIHDELYQQRESDQQWRPVIDQMTAGCLPIDDIFGANGCLRQIVERPLQAIAVATGGAVAALPVAVPTPIPRHFEESLEIIANKP
ncbi:hypothetical protein [Ramlibacter sp. 2FC]|uniref:hypothetical protein n=1 Tax=Ramlibacter sp. 2FC TaxID=2502188 RepID=UPI0010F9BB13|nr:hypothetical protein [Ramlibacter sp. 2FC]